MIPDGAGVLDVIFSYTISFNIYLEVSPDDTGREEDGDVVLLMWGTDDTGLRVTLMEGAIVIVVSNLQNAVIYHNLFIRSTSLVYM